MNQDTQTTPTQPVGEERPDLLDTSEESPKTPADRQGFEPFQYAERN